MILFWDELSDRVYYGLILKPRIQFSNLMEFSTFAKFRTAIRIRIYSLDRLIFSLFCPLPDSLFPLAVFLLVLLLVNEGRGLIGGLLSALNGRDRHLVQALFFVFVNSLFYDAVDIALIGVTGVLE